MSTSPKRESVAPKAAPVRRSIEGQGRSVLIADDHEDTRIMLRTMLELNRFYVLEATNGVAAVLLTERERPDIVLMDFGLPIIDGLAALRLIRANKTNCGVPVIFLTGRAEPAAQIAVRAAGCNDYLLKPINLDQVLQLIELRLVSSAEVTE